MNDSSPHNNNPSNNPAANGNGQQTPTPHGQPESQNYWGKPPETPTAHRENQQQPPHTPPMQPPYDYQTQNGYQQSQNYNTQNPAYNHHNQSGYYGQPGQPVQNSVAVAQPPKKHTGLIIGIIIAAAVVASIGICGLGVHLFSETLSNQQESAPNFLGNNKDDADDSPFALEATTPEDNNEDFREYYGLTTRNDDQPLSADELSQISDKIAKNQTAKEKDVYQPGVYTVGKDIPAGTYWITGDESTLSYYFVLSPTNNNANNAGKATDNAARALNSTTRTVADSSAYNVWMVNHYYGNSIIELSDADVLVINEQALPIDKVSQKFSAPYKSGMYRVGTDIPAGTYTLCPGSAHDYYAYYVMSDVTYKGNCYLDYDNYLNVNKQDTITLKEGTYIELYNVTLKSNTV